MSSFYNKFRDEIVAGGDTNDQPKRINDKRTSLIAGLVLLALIIWLGVSSPWTFVFVVGLLVSIFLHEMGHFVTARRTGMKVTQFLWALAQECGVCSVEKWSTASGLCRLEHLFE